MMVMRRAGCAFVLALCGISPAFAQTFTVPEVLAVVRVEADKDETPDALMRTYYSGDWTKLAANLNSLIRKAAPAKEKNCQSDLPKEWRESGVRCFDTDANYYSIVLSGKDPFGQPASVRVLLNDDVAEPFTNLMPGVGQQGGQPLMELLIGSTSDVIHRSMYASTREANPLDAQVGSFVSVLDQKVLALVAGEIDRQRSQPPAAAPAAAGGDQVWLTLRLVVLPFARAAVTVKDVISTDVVSEIRNNLSAIKAGLTLRGARYAPCATMLAETIDTRWDDLLNANPSCKGGGDPAPCLKMLRDSAREAFRGAIPACEANVRAECAASARRAGDKTAEQACQSAPVPAADYEAALLVEKTYVDRASVEPKTQTVETKLVNDPLTRWGFGLATVFLLKEELEANRVKIDDGTLAPDPLPRRVTMAIVNYAPWGYPRLRTTPSNRERWNFFAGAVLTPDPGLGGGFVFNVFRGLGLNVGWTWLWVNTPGSGKNIGDEPDKAHPFKRRATGSAFAGFSYNFKS